MKTKILLLFAFFSIVSYAQIPINSFYIDDTALFSVVTTGTPLDQTASGTNKIWNFNQLLEIGYSNYSNVAPTTSELNTFPTTSSVVVASNTVNSVTSTSQIFNKNVANVVSITGIISTDLVLNFSTNNATLGAFPMNYGFANSDVVAGTYNYTTYSGTFTGTLITSVDAYGTLNLNVGALSTYNATRLKTVLTISLNYGFFTNVGTITQTTYNYYSTDIGSNSPVFKTATTAAVVPLASINQTDTTMESYYASTLVTKSFELASQIQISPNPVEDLLHIKLNGNQSIHSISISDSNGRIIANGSLENASNVSRLQKGIYFATITTDAGNITKKFIKK